MKSLQSGFAPAVLVAVIAGVLILGSAAYFGANGFKRVYNDPQVPQNVTPVAPIVQSNSTDTSTWKTYRNEKYGFEFRYPPSWDEHFVSSNRVQIDILTHKGTNAKELAEQIECGDGGDGNEGCPALYNKSTEEIQVGNIKVWLRIDGRDQMHAYFDTTVPFSTIEVYMGLGDEDIFRKLISTFKFLQIDG